MHLASERTERRDVVAAVFVLLLPQLTQNGGFVAIHR